MVQTGPIIDGAVPRTGEERCNVLLDHAQALVEGIDPLDLTRYDLLRIELDGLRQEVKAPRIIHAGMWHELEDDLIEFLNDALPDEYVCVLGEPNPGDVIITDREEE